MWAPKGCAKLFLAGSSGEQAIGSSPIRSIKSCRADVVTTLELRYIQSSPPRKDNGLPLRNVSPRFVELCCEMGLLTLLMRVIRRAIAVVPFANVSSAVR